MFKKVLSFNEAKDKFFKVIKVAKTCDIKLENAFNEIIANDIKVDENIPLFDRSPYDGFCFRYEDTLGVNENNKKKLKIIDYIKAGDTSKKTIKENECIKLMTGAKVPKGASAISPFEIVKEEDSFIEISREYKKGQNIIFAGEDLKKGEKIIDKGTKLDSASIGTLSSLNKTKVRVYKKLNIALISTGDELQEIGKDLKPGKIYNSNRYTLTSILKKEGFLVDYIGIVKDKSKDIEKALTKALKNHDAVITTGGVSVGDYDETKNAIKNIKAKVIFDRVNIKPGMACSYAIKNDKPIIALSGNPVSSIINFYLMGLPALKKMSGLKNYDLEYLDCILLKDIKFKPMNGDKIYKGKLIYNDCNLYVDIFDKQGNIQLGSSINSDFLVIANGNIELKKDMKVRGIKI